MALICVVYLCCRQVQVLAIEKPASSEQSQISICLVRNLESGHLLGLDESSSIKITRPTIQKDLPKTNDQVSSYALIFGYLIITWTWFMWVCQRKK